MSEKKAQLTQKKKKDQRADGTTTKTNSPTKGFNLTVQIIPLNVSGRSLSTEFKKMAVNCFYRGAAVW